jgi:hypothetical protein
MKERPAAELKRLRGDRTKVDWAALLQVPYRTYMRYEKGERDVPPVVLVAARQAVQLEERRTGQGRSPRKRGA